MLNRYCSKVKEEATISSKATERIKKVTLSLLRAIALQTKIQVSNILRNYGIDFNSLPELENVFSPYLLEHGAPELLARTGLGSDFENLSPREIELGRRRQWKKRKNGKRRIVEYKESNCVHGTCFKKDLNTILLAQMTDSQPVFGSLENVWLSATHVFFGLKLYKTADFSIDLNAYQIEEEEMATGLFVIEVGDLLMTSVMHIYKHERCQYVCPGEDPSTLLDN
ncbi:uncharacterized protein LOC141894960 [Acropora palmata]|uniref:uncharacterized protein LOC141894960 n=1 Tax=Acropora palmata TaxID=6131 RepID=UPI003DA0770D